MIARVAIFILFTIAFTVTGLSAQPGDVSRISPHPSLKPVDVVRIVMTALQHNDIGGKNRGIAITYNFASPANKRMTGPLSRFISLVRGPVYGEMINHKGASYETVLLKGQNAQVDVIIRTISGKFKGFRFTLSRQRGNAHEGSWMTDSVVPFNVTAT